MIFDSGNSTDVPDEQCDRFFLFYYPGHKGGWSECIQLEQSGTELSDSATPHEAAESSPGDDGGSSSPVPLLSQTQPRASPPPFHQGDERGRSPSCTRRS